MVMDYGAFRRAVNYIDGVYVDIDRDYFNDNSSGENYATIDVDPGYQKLMGKDALDYVRYRHGDNDLVRAARQQDFLRQAKNAAGVRQLLSGGLGEKPAPDPGLQPLLPGRQVAALEQAGAVAAQARDLPGREEPEGRPRSASRRSTRRTRSCDSNLYVKDSRPQEGLPAAS